MGKSASKMTISIDPHRETPKNRWILLQKWGNQQPRNCGEIKSNALKYQFLAKKGKSAPRNPKQNAGTPETI